MPDRLAPCILVWHWVLPCPVSLHNFTLPCFPAWLHPAPFPCMTSPCPVSLHNFTLPCFPAWLHPALFPCMTSACLLLISLVAWTLTLCLDSTMKPSCLYCPDCHALTCFHGNLSLLLIQFWCLQVVPISSRFNIKLNYMFFVTVTTGLKVVLKLKLKKRQPGSRFTYGTAEGRTEDYRYLHRASVWGVVGVLNNRQYRICLIYRHHVPDWVCVSLFFSLQYGIYAHIVHVFDEKTERMSLKEYVHQNRSRRRGGWVWGRER